MQKIIFYKKTTLFLVIILILPSCGYQKFCSNQVAKNIHDSIFIQMPKNSLVFDNVSSLLYRALFLTYKRLGYNLSINPADALVLKTKIESLEPIEKFISQELLLYNIRVGLIVHCRMFDKDKKLIAEKKFEDFRLISFPKDPIQNSKFLDFEYRKLMNKISIKIEHFFREYLIFNNIN